MSNVDQQPRFDAECSRLRTEIKAYGAQVRMLMAHSAMSATLERDSGEMKANIMLAYRHLEDAQMRLGKAIQAFDGGKSVYDPVDAARLKEKP